MPYAGHAVHHLCIPNNLLVSNTVVWVSENLSFDSFALHKQLLQGHIRLKSLLEYSTEF